MQSGLTEILSCDFFLVSGLCDADDCSVSRSSHVTRNAKEQITEPHKKKKNLHEKNLRDPTTCLRSKIKKTYDIFTKHYKVILLKYPWPWHQPIANQMNPFGLTEIRHEPNKIKSGPPHLFESNKT